MSDGHDANGDGAPAGLREAARAYLAWRDKIPGNAEGSAAAIGRAMGQKLMAAYVFALAKLAARCGADAEELEPARRLAVALNDGGWGFGNPLFRHEDEIHDIAWARWGGRKAPSRLWMEGRAIGCVHFMVDFGVAVPRACAIVADAFATMGHRGRKGGRLSGRMVREWHDSLTTPMAAPVAAERDGWARAESVADLERQNEALETMANLLRRTSAEPDWKSWIAREMLLLAHSCAADPPSEFIRLGHI